MGMSLPYRPCPGCGKLKTDDTRCNNHPCEYSKEIEVKDNINPDHYKFGGIETIDYMKAKMTPEGFEGYLQGNVLKYVSRYSQKNGLEDLKKANWYLSRLIEVYSRFDLKN